MSDPVDTANDIEQRALERQIAAARAPIAVGVAGECEGCGEQMPRLVQGYCGFCRDGRR
jgi:RNA polymerase-binding transcription factor DksA